MERCPAMWCHLQGEFTERWWNSVSSIFRRSCRFPRTANCRETWEFHNAAASWIYKQDRALGSCRSCSSCSTLASSWIENICIALFRAFFPLIFICMSLLWLECLGCNPVSDVTSTGSPRCRASICGSSSCIWPECVGQVAFFATKLSISNVASCHINRALLHSPVIEGVTNLTMLLFHCCWWLLVLSSCWPVLPQADS